MAFTATFVSTTTKFATLMENAVFAVLMGATADGTMELIAVVDGFRESELSCKEMLLNLKARGLRYDPLLAVGDCALGF